MEILEKRCVLNENWTFNNNKRNLQNFMNLIFGKIDDVFDKINSLYFNGNKIMQHIFTSAKNRFSADKILEAIQP